MHKETKVFGIIYLIVWGMLMIHCVYRFYLNWPIMIKDIGMFLIFPIVVHCVWAIPGLKKMNAKKEQKNSIISLFVLFILTVMFCCVFNQFCGVIIYSRYSTDASKLSNIQEQICATIEELDTEGSMNPEGNTNPEGSVDPEGSLNPEGSMNPEGSVNPALGSRYLSLVDGTTLTDWGTPDDEFSKELAGRLNISSFSELEDQFYCVTGKAVVTVKLVDGVPFVTLENAVARKGPVIVKRTVPSTIKE